jgi:hypothetical protein
MPKVSQQRKNEETLHIPTGLKTYVLESIPATSKFFESGEAFFWSIEDNGVAVSPLFASSDGATMWLRYMIANEMIDHRVFQFGLDCLCFIDGSYIWWSDTKQELDTDDIYWEYDDAVNAKLLGNII